VRRERSGRVARGRSSESAFGEVDASPVESRGLVFGPEPGKPRHSAEIECDDGGEIEIRVGRRQELDRIGGSGRLRGSRSVCLVGAEGVSFSRTAIAERFVLTLRRELLGRMIFIGEERPRNACAARFGRSSSTATSRGRIRVWAVRFSSRGTRSGGGP
jgi:hypothetical protein